MLPSFPSIRSVRAASAKSATSKDQVLQNNPYTDVQSYGSEAPVLSPTEDIDPMLSKVLVRVPGI